MKLPEDEQKSYEHYKENLHYQASMFESSFDDEFNEGKVKGKAEGRIEGRNELTQQLVINMAKNKISIETIKEVRPNKNKNHIDFKGKKIATPLNYCFFQSSLPLLICAPFSLEKNYV